MENSLENNVERSVRGEVRVQDLHLDRVVASQPEIGPTPPDGGYGWLIVLSAVVYNLTAPTLLSLYGFVVLKGIREEDHDEGEVLRIWDVDIALVPVLMVVIRLLLESWCRAMVKVICMPRFIALSGLCMTAAGVLLSSYSTESNSNDHIISTFAGIFAGSGCALTGQQTEVIITHYFRDKLTFAQRLMRMAPSIGNALVPILVGYLSTVYTGDVVVMIYGAILMQNSFFLAAYTRPIYIERVIRHTYNMLRDAVEDEDEVIFANQARSQNSRTVQDGLPQDRNEAGGTTQEDETDVVVFNSKQNAKEIFDPSVQYREKNTEPRNDLRFSSDFSQSDVTNRFSSNFSDVLDTANRFSSDFGDVNSFSRSGYQELENIENSRQTPQPLYRETTVNAPQANTVFTAEMTPGTARRTASLKKHFITLTSMLADLNFYLYVLLHLCSTFSILVLGVLFPPMVWEQNPSMNIWSVALLTAMAHGCALCFIMLYISLPNQLNKKARLSAGCCFIGAIGFFGLTITNSKTLLVVWCMLCSVSTATSTILLQPLYSSSFNDLDTTTTMTSSNTIVAILIMIWALAFNYTYKTCFWMATILQIMAASAFFVSSFRRRR